MEPEIVLGPGHLGGIFNGHSLLLTFLMPEARIATEFWLSERQRLAPPLPRKSQGVPRVDDRGVISGIVHVPKSGDRWVDAPALYGKARPSTTGSSAGALTEYSSACFRRSRKQAALLPSFSSSALTSWRTAAPLEEKGAPNLGHRRQPRRPHIQDPCSDRWLRSPRRLLPYRRPCR